MMTISRHIFLTAVIALAGFSVSAQEAKIGIVNLDRILRDANSAKAAQTKLEQEFGKREKDLNDIATQLKTASDKFEREAPTLSETQRNARQKQLVDQDRDFQRKRRELQEDSASRRNEEVQQLIERVNRAVKALAEAEKYDLIVQEAAYVNPRLDITDKVLRILNSANGK
jgi:outer membrane protein